MNVLISHIDVFPVTLNEMLWYVVGQFKCIVLWLIVAQKNKTALSVSFAKVFDCAFNDILVFTRVVVMSQAGCTVLSCVTFRLYRGCPTL